MKKLIGLFVVLLMMGLVAAAIPSDQVSELGTEGGFEKPIGLTIYGKIGKTVSNGKQVNIEFKEDKGVINISHEGERFPRSYKHLKKGSKFTVRDKKLVRADFTVEAPFEDGKFEECPHESCPVNPEHLRVKIGNREYTLYSGSKVEYKLNDDGSEDISITHPEGKVAIPPGKVDDKKKNEDIDIKYTTEGDKMSIDDGKSHVAEFTRMPLDGGDKGELEFSYDTDKGRFFITQATVYKNAQIGVVRNADRTYLFLEEDIPLDYDKAAVSVGGSFKTAAYKGRSARDLGSSAVLMHVPKDHGGFAVRMRAGEGVGGDFKMGDKQEFVVFAQGDGKIFGKVVGNKGSEEISRVVISSRPGSGSREAVPVVDAPGAFHLINSNGIYYANDKTNGIRQSHFDIDKPFVATGSDGKKLTLNYHTYETVPVQILYGDGKSYKGLAGSSDKRNPKFGVFIDKDHRVLVAADDKLDALFSDAKFHTLDHPERDLLNTFVFNGGSTEEIFKGIDFLQGDYKKLSDEQKKLFRQYFPKEKSFDKFIEGNAAAEIAKLVPKEPVKPEVKVGGTVTLAEIHPLLAKAPRGVILFSNIKRSDSKVVVKVGYKGCPGCNSLSADLRAKMQRGLINGPIIDMDSRMFGGKVGGYPNLVQQYNIGSVPTTLYFERDAQGKLVEVGRDQKNEGSGIIKFFK